MNGSREAGRLKKKRRGVLRPSQPQGRDPTPGPIFIRGGQSEGGVLHRQRVVAVTLACRPILARGVTRVSHKIIYKPKGCGTRSGPCTNAFMCSTHIQHVRITINIMA